MVARGDENADGHILTADDYTQLNLVFSKGFKMLTQLNEELAGKQSVLVQSYMHPSYLLWTSKSQLRSYPLLVNICKYSYYCNFSLIACIVIMCA